MRLVISQCKHCLHDSDTCQYRKSMRAAISKVKGAGVLRHNCAEYWDCWNEGDRVRVELKEIEIGEEREYVDEGIYVPIKTAEWVSRGFVSGSVSGRQGNKTSRFVVRLDSPTKLRLPRNGESWEAADEIDVTHVTRYANKIQAVKEGE